MYKLSDLLVIDREEAEMLYQAWSEWWIPRIKTDPKEKVVQYDKLNKILRNFLAENTT